MLSELSIRWLPLSRRSVSSVLDARLRGEPAAAAETQPGVAMPKDPETRRKLDRIVESPAFAWGS
jgi:hypothetical protein